MDPVTGQGWLSYSEPVPLLPGIQIPGFQFVLRLVYFVFFCFGDRVIIHKLIESRLLRQCFDVNEQVSQVVVADVPARHIRVQLCDNRIFTVHNRQAKFFGVELTFQD